MFRRKYEVATTDHTGRVVALDESTDLVQAAEDFSYAAARMVPGDTVTVRQTNPWRRRFQASVTYEGKDT